jgi:hypothetical protein
VLDEQSVDRLLAYLERNPEKLAAMLCLVAGESLPHPQGAASSAGSFPAPQRGHLPGNLAAVVEGDPASGCFCIRFAPSGAAVPAAPPEPPEAAPQGLIEGAKVIQLLKALDRRGRLRKAPPITVYLLRFLKNLPYSEIARECKCTRALVCQRLKAIRQQLPWKPQQLREVAPQVQAIEEALTDSRARRIYRKGAVYGEEQDGEGLE